MGSYIFALMGIGARYKKTGQCPPGHLLTQSRQARRPLFGPCGDLETLEHRSSFTLSKILPRGAVRSLSSRDACQ